MKPVAFHSAARGEFRKAVVRYENRQHGLGLRFYDNVHDAVSRIQQTPDSFPSAGVGDVQMLILRRFPYTVYYQEKDNHIRVVAIAHHSRRLNYWARRIK